MTAPPSASAPHSTEFGPRTISTDLKLLMSKKSRLPSVMLSCTREPSTVKSTRFPPIPRMVKLLSWPQGLVIEVVRLTLTPGSWRTRSWMSRTL
ncbi:hypothetical protein D3C87_1702190 [compost metagenome]